MPGGGDGSHSNSGLLSKTWYSRTIPSLPPVKKRYLQAAEEQSPTDYAEYKHIVIQSNTCEKENCRWFAQVQRDLRVWMNLRPFSSAGIYHRMGLGSKACSIYSILIFAWFGSIKNYSNVDSNLRDFGNIVDSGHLPPCYPTAFLANQCPFNSAKEWNNKIKWKSCSDEVRRSTYGWHECKWKPRRSPHEIAGSCFWTIQMKYSWDPRKKIIPH